MSDDKDARTEWVDAFVRWLTQHSDAQPSEAEYEAAMEAETQADVHGDDPHEWDHPDTAAARVRDEWGDAANEESDDD